MLCKTKVSKRFQTVVPSEIRKAISVSPGDTLEWRSTKDGFIVEFKKKVTLEDVFGMVSIEGMDAVEAKKRVQRGEKY
jgi:AbrB family looped-hinge helix DNA binding protein